MPPKERNNKTPPGQKTSPPTQELNWQQLQAVNAPTSSFSPLMTAALEECEMKFIVNLPDSELQNAVRLFFQIEQAHWFYEDHIVDAPNSGVKSVRIKDFALKLFKFSDLLKPQRPKFEAMFGEWLTYKHSIPTYGCILLNEQLTHMVLVCNWQGTSWTLPRGKVDQNEDGATCAAREVEEETGYRPEGLSEEDSDVVITEGGQRCKMFYHRGVPLDYPFAPLARKEISRVEFFPFDAYPQNSWMVAEYLPKLKRWCKQQRRKPKPAALAAAKAAHAAAAAAAASGGAVAAGGGGTALAGALGNHHSNNHQGSYGHNGSDLPREASRPDGPGKHANASKTSRTSSNNGASAASQWQFARGKPFTFDLADIMSAIPTTP